MNVESVTYVLKRRFNGTNYSRITLQNKETKLKDVLYNLYRTIQLLTEGFNKLIKLNISTIQLLPYIN